jgi:hypothetical protein
MDRKLGRLVLVLALVTVWSNVARATDDNAKAAARALANEAKRDFDAGLFEDAERKFQRAYAVARVPTLALWTARTLAKRGQLVAASELYRQATQLTPNDLWIGNAQQKAQADAIKEYAELQPRIPKLRIHVEGGSPGQVELTIDEVKILDALLGFDFPVDPGNRHIVGKSGAQTFELSITLGEGERKDALLKFTTDPSLTALDKRAGKPATPSLATPGTTSAAGDTTSLTSAPFPSDPNSNKQPPYKKWWFWSGIGAAVVAGTVTAFLLTRSSGGGCSGAVMHCVEVR